MHHAWLAFLFCTFLWKIHWLGVPIGLLFSMAFLQEGIFFGQSKFGVMHQQGGRCFFNSICPGAYLLEHGPGSADKKKEVRVEQVHVDSHAHADDDDVHIAGYTFVEMHL